MEMKKETVNASLFDHIRTAANELRGSGLTDEVLTLEDLDIIREALKLSDRKEAAVIAIMAAQPQNQTVDTNDMANFLSCSDFDVMALSAAVKSLTEKGFLAIDEDSLYPLPQYSFAEDILESIVENREVRPQPIIVSSDYDQFNLCADVRKLLCKRKQNKITTNTLFSEAQHLEDDHADIEFIQKMKSELKELKHRVIAYDLCYEYASNKGDEMRMRAILAAIYSSPMQAALEQKALRMGDHPLVAHEFVSVEDDEKLHVEDHMLRLLYGDAAEAYVSNVKQTDRYAFVGEIDDIFHRQHFGKERSKAQLVNDALKVEKSNRDLSMVKNLALRVPNADDRIVFYMVCNDRLHNEDFEVSCLNDIFEPFLCVNCRRQLLEGTHALLKSGLVEVQPADMFDNAVLALTEAGEALFFEKDAELFEEPLTGSDIIQPDTMVEKHLFFDDELEGQLSLLGKSLQEGSYQKLVKRLTDKHMPTGVCALLYGCPGTGKTESVMQLARQTGRAVMHVDISETKSCWFGASEKLIKGVFARYRKLCKKSKIKPILLFNEADGVLSKRKDSNRSNVAQTENAMQNIILEEMEKLDGIMIATTNLANNLDSAFERRFLFKVRFDAPTLDAKCSIWVDKLPSLSKEEAKELAKRFAFSGGEIDNVVRKAEMDELLTGTAPTLESIIGLCSKEKLGNGHRSIGFAY